MKPRTLSASALQSFVCPARFHAEYVERAPSASSSPAALGTSCHNALEDFVANGWAQSGEPEAVLLKLYDHHYHQIFTDDERYAEGIEMMKRWHERQDWTGITVISTEKKQTFNLPTSQGVIPFTFIFDRLDMAEDGTVTVVDYKSNMVPFNVDELRGNLQARIYGMAVRILYPDAPAVWVKFDFLRHEPVAVKYTPAENRETWDFLKGQAELVLTSNGTEEVINDKCRWCIRRHTCDTLMAHVAAGGPQSITSLEDAAERRYRYYAAKKALEDMVAEMDEFITDQMEEEGITELSTPQYDISLGASRRREANGPIIHKVMGDRMEPYIKINVGDVDRMLVEQEASPEEIQLVRDSVQKKFGRVTVKVKPKSNPEED
jgi:RecB family exonuclease